MGFYTLYEKNPKEEQWIYTVFCLGSFQQLLKLCLSPITIVQHSWDVKSLTSQPRRVIWV